MDWKREAIDKLKNYEAKRTSITRSEEEIRRLELSMKSIRSATTDGTPVSGGTNHREDAMINNIALREELERAREEADAWCRFVDSGLSMLDDDERIVLDRMFIHPAKGNVERLCEELGLQDTRSVYKRREKALRHFTFALYGVMET